MYIYIYIYVNIYIYIYIYNLYSVKGIFPDDLNIARITPIFKGGDNKELFN